MNVLVLSWCCLVAGACLSALPLHKNRFREFVGAGSAMLGSLLGLIAAGQGLAADTAQSLHLPWSMPGGSFALHLDGLSAFFLLPLFLIGFAGALYGMEYMRHEQARLHWGWYNLLLVSMSMVVTAANGLLFLFAWECMSLTSFFLVISEHNRAETVQAGWTYLLATHLGAACLFAFFLTAGALTGSLDFSSFHALSGLAAPVATVLFCLLVAGFGSKAGLFPLHVWLPDAHPAAPSHVSALMSGVMVKTAIYGLLRLCSFLPVAPVWWGGLLMGLGMVGALFGIAMAAMQRDVKRSLAYSTVENIGILFLALGLWMQSRAAGHAAIAALALAGGLIHLLNHALFKSLLFLGAGSLLHATGSRNLNHMGGLMRRMPLTSLMIVCGGMAISALPPFNGLIGEWYLYRALLEGAADFSGLSGFFPAALVGLLALVGGMTIVVTTRIIGIALAGEPRSEGAARAREAGWPMRGAMMGLALACAVCGLVPLVLLRVAGRAAVLLDDRSAPLFAGQGLSPVWMGTMAALLLGAMLAVFILNRWRQGRGEVTSAATWGCGFAFPTSRMSYSADGYSEIAQSGVFCSCLTPVNRDGRSIALFPGGRNFVFSAPDPVLERFFRPLFRWAAGSCRRCCRLQSGNLHIYLLYVFCATILLLFWVGQR